MMANLVSGRPTCAREPKTRKSVARASSSPPPSASPLMAEIVGIGRAEMSRSAPRRFARNAAVCSGVNVARSFRSAPAQKTPGTLLARISARLVVVVVVESEVGLRRGVICSRSSFRSALEMAFLLEGRARVRRVMWPVCAAGMVVLVIRGGAGAVV